MTAVEIEDILSEWTPGRTVQEEETFYTIGASALEWLRERNAPAARLDFEDALYEDTTPEELDNDAWWRRIVRPALREARDAGAVEYKHGGRHRYRWVAGHPDLCDFQWVEKE